MPIIKSAIKRMKQTATRRARNIGIKTDIKTAIKAFRAKPTSENLSKAQSEIDTAVKKKLLKKNTASRRKAQLAREAKNAGVKLTARKTAKKPSSVKKTPAKVVKKPATKKAATKPAAKKAPVTKKTTPKKK